MVYDADSIIHRCNVLDIKRVSKNLTHYSCSVCKKLIATSDIDKYGIDIVVYVDAEDYNKQEKIYPILQQAEYDIENQELWK